MHYRFHQTYRRKKVFTMAAVTLHDTDPACEVSVAFTDDKGQETFPDSAPTWSESSAGAVVTLSPASDGLSATITPVAPGASTITVVTQDNNGVTVTVTGDVTVAGGSPTEGKLTFVPGVTAPAGAGDEGTTPA